MDPDLVTILICFVLAFALSVWGIMRLFSGSHRGGRALTVVFLVIGPIGSICGTLLLLVPPV